MMYQRPLEEERLDRPLSDLYARLLREKGGVVDSLAISKTARTLYTTRIARLVLSGDYKRPVVRAFLFAQQQLENTGAFNDAQIAQVFRSADVSSDYDFIQMLSRLGHASNAYRELCYTHQYTDVFANMLAHLQSIVDIARVEIATASQESELAAAE